MILANLLDPRAIVFEHRVLNKEQVFEILVERICHYYDLPVCGNALLKLILDRDREINTAYPTGIAIPHIRMDNYADTVVAMAFLQNPLDCDGIKVHWVCLIITDKSSSNLYLNLVAALLKLSRDEHSTAALHQQSDGGSVVQLLKKWNIDIKKEITVADIMVPDPVCIAPEALVTDLIGVLCSKNLSFLPVVDERGLYLGEVNILKLLKVGVPDYLMMLDNLSFLSAYEPLEKLFEQESLICVKEIMESKAEHLSPDTSIPEAVFEMIQHHKRFYSVVDEYGKLVGVITAMDIFRKVIKA